MEDQHAHRADPTVTAGHLVGVADGRRLERGPKTTHVCCAG